ncbi:MAG TPA: molybdopterin cofactor-binding domain-containing protein, partial [Reyranella sp.]|nr:molybdopterin cofactor-binding domain-containing protein [Reyranella sp.]
PMEPRSAIGSYDPKTERWTLNVGCQGVMGMRGGLARDVLKVPTDKVRVLTGNVGGSFGMKSQVYPEYGPLLLGAKLLGRPVKWTDERSESFLSDHHGRDHQRVAELALDKDGRFLAVRLSGTGNAGAYIYPPMPATTNAVKNIIDVYATPAMEVNSKVVFTNTTPIGAYRGAGRPEGNYYMERLIDTAAREMGIDKVELRRRNHIAPSQMPYKAPSAMNYDSGEFTTVLDKALQAADWQGFDRRKAESRAKNKLRGRGIGSYLEVTGPPAKEYGGVRFEADGTITMLSGTLDYGQGHATPFAQVLGGKLGIPVPHFRLLQGDSDQLKVGGGTGGSKSALVASQAFLEAGDKVIEQGKQIAAHVLEASAVDIEFARGRFTIAGTDRGIGSYLEVTGPPAKEYGGVRFEADGTITMLSGTLDYGQGHATPFAQVLGGKLGIPVPHFRLLQGDSDQLKVGGGTGGSKSALVASQAFLEAGDKVIEQGKQIAAHVLEASAADMEFSRGRFVIAGTDRGIGILELAGKLRSGLKLPADVPQSLDVSHISDNPPFSFPNGCHIAEVEIDRDTGVIEVVRYFMVNDFGTIINPMLTAGQAHGGVMQGIGQALMERTVYDPQGQPVAGSYMDYALPRAADAPDMSVQNHSVPCKTNLLGVKGCGEAGCAGALPSVMNAVVDALSEFGVTHIDMPATPEKVWRVMNGAK